MKYFLIALVFYFVACKHKQPLASNQPLPLPVVAPADTVIAKENNEEDDDINGEYDYQDTAFASVKQYPTITDTAAFIKALKSNCHLWMRPYNVKYATIAYFKKLPVFGSNKDVYIIQLNYPGGAMAEYPWKNQFIFTTGGKLIKMLDEVYIDTATIFPGKKPFLFGMVSTAKGNGGHEVYRVRHDTLEQVYDGFLGTRPQTYSTGYSWYVTEPNELYHKFIDVNKDGFNDIVFYGKVMSENKRNDTIAIPVTYIFIYHSKTGHFTEREDYSRKYEYLYGDTK